MALFPIDSQQFLEFIDVAARNGDGIVAVTHHELHGARIRGDLFYLAEVDHESTMATYNRGINLKRVFHLFHRGAKHIGMHFIILQLANFHIVANCF